MKNKEQKIIKQEQKEAFSKLFVVILNYGFMGLLSIVSALAVYFALWFLI